MKIKVIKDCKFSFAPAEKIVFFKVGEICELSDKRANRLIDHDYAIEYSESNKSEQKMDKTETENKMFSAKHKEDKTEEVEQEKQEEGEVEVEVKHEDKQDKPKKRGRPPKK